MSTIGKRLGYYGIGVAIGVVFVYFLFGDRDIQCSYFPNARVLKDLRSKELMFTDAADCQRDCLALDSLDVKQIFAAGAIDFSASEARKKPCGEYELITRLPDQREIISRIENCDSTVTVLWFKEENTTCGCDD